MTSRIDQGRFSASRFLADLGVDVRLWLAERGLWWGTSVVVHALILSAMVLLLGTFGLAPPQPADLVALVSEPIETPAEELIEHFVVQPIDPAPLDRPLDLTALELQRGDTMEPSDSVSAPGDLADGVTLGCELPFLEGMSPPVSWMAADISGPGPGPKRPGVPGIYAGRIRGTGGGRSHGGITGATKPGDLAVARALRWIARHQNPDGSWSLDAFSARCRRGACDGQGNLRADAAATALSLLPFLAAGQTHLKGVAIDKDSVDYRAQVNAGAYWLLDHQKVDGDLSAGSDQVLYSHGLATIALAELFALSHDKHVGSSAQRAVDFICQAQHPETGGWRYRPGERGDTSVAGWQIMALKSAQIAGLSVPSRTIELAHRWLHSTAQSQGGLFSYEPAGGATPTMTAVGLLATQYLGADGRGPAMQEGMRYLLSQLPTAETRNCYYWYYATQVMHNLSGSEWDQWNRKMRSILIASQSSTPDSCSMGSWDPAEPSPDAWGQQGGRLMVTCLNCLTLQVYYRYLPLYQLDGAGRAK